MIISMVQKMKDLNYRTLRSTKYMGGNYTKAIKVTLKGNTCG